MKKIMLKCSRKDLHLDEWSKKRGLDLLNNVCESPTSIILAAKDGGIEHAVATVGRWIFDSSMTQALPLTQESLDWCCVNGYKAVHRAHRYLPKKKTVT
jgi:hypothetical protein